MDMYEINKGKLDENMFDDIEDTQEYEAFKIDNDVKAEWGIKKIAEHKAEYERMKALCENMISEYKNKILEAEKDFERNTGYFKSQLRNYFESVPHKKTKTKESYKLASGSLVLKIKAPEVKRDNEKLLEWAKSNGYEYNVKITESLNWADLKKDLKQVDNKYVTADGVIVEGVELLQRDNEFEVEI